MDKRVFLATWKDIPAANEVQYEIQDVQHSSGTCRGGAGGESQGQVHRAQGSGQCTVWCNTRSRTCRVTGSDTCAGVTRIMSVQGGHVSAVRGDQVRLVHGVWSGQISAQRSFWVSVWGLEQCREVMSVCGGQFRQVSAWRSPRGHPGQVFGFEYTRKDPNEGRTPICFLTPVRVLVAIQSTTQASCPLPENQQKSFVLG